MTNMLANNAAPKTSSVTVCDQAQTAALLDFKKTSLTLLPKPQPSSKQVQFSALSAWLYPWVTAVFC